MRTRSFCVLAVAALVAAVGAVGPGVGRAAPAIARAQVEEDAYTSPTWGYTVTWDDDYWHVLEESSEDERDLLKLGRPGDGDVVTTATFDGFAGHDGDPAACLEEAESNRRDDPNFEDFAPADDLERPAPAAAAAAELYRYHSAFAGLDLALYVECRTLVEDEAVLRIELKTYLDQFEDEFLPAFEDLLAGVEGDEGDEDKGDDEAGTAGETYESLQYGYVLTYDPDEWEVVAEDEDPDDPYDQLLLSNGTSLVFLVGDPDYDDELDDCLDDYVAALEADDAASGIELFDERDAEGQDVNRAWTTYAYAYEDDAGKEEDRARYVACRWLGDGLTLVVVHDAPADDYEVEVEAREELLEGFAPAATAESDENRDRDDEEGEDGDAVSAAVWRGNPAHTGEQPGPAPEPEIGPLWWFPAGGAATSVTVADGIAYFFAEPSAIHAVDAADGEPIWEVAVEAGGAAPTVIEGVVYGGTAEGDVTATTGRIYALDAATGDERWTVEGPGVSAPVTVADGVVYAARWDGTLTARATATGDELWTVELTRPGVLLQSPAVAQGRLFVGAATGAFFALDAETGDPLWDERLRDEVNTTAAVVNEVVYVGVQDYSTTPESNYVFALDVQTGQELWMACCFDGGASQPAVADGVVYVGGGRAGRNGTLTALAAATGAEIWEIDYLDDRLVAPVVVGEWIYAGSRGDDGVYAIVDEGRKGNVVWQMGTGLITGPTSAPVVVDGVIYVGGGDGVYAIGGGFSY